MKTFLMIVFCFFVFFYIKNNKVHQEEYKSTKQEVVVDTRLIKADMGGMLYAYRNNEISADSLYKNRRIEVTGFVDTIKKDITDKMYITLGTGKEFEVPKIQAFFDNSETNSLINLRKGNTITVVCTIKGLMFNVIAEKCEIKK